MMGVLCKYFLENKKVVFQFGILMFGKLILRDSTKYFRYLHLQAFPPLFLEHPRGTMKLGSPTFLIMRILVVVH